MSVRTECLSALLALWADTDGIRDLDQVEAFDPDELAQEAIYVGPITGRDNYELIMGGTDNTFDDEFQLVFGVMAMLPGQSAAEARERCEGFAVAMRRAIAADVGLGGIVNDALEVTSAEFEGPDVLPGTEGWGAVGTITVRVVATIGAFT